MGLLRQELIESLVVGLVVEVLVVWYALFSRLYTPPVKRNPSDPGTKR